MSSLVFRRLLVLFGLLSLGAGLPACSKKAHGDNSTGNRTSIPNSGASVKKVSKTIVNKSLDQVGLSSSALDRSVSPCTDFYRFACGGWIKKTKIPADRARWMRSFSEIHKRNEWALRTILFNAVKAKTSDPVTRKLGGYFGACYNVAGVEKQGLKAIQPLFKVVGAVTDAASLARAVTELHRHKLWALFDLSAEQDFKDATKMIGYLDQNGLGLPDRDYYLKKDPKSVAARKHYVEHVARMLILSGLKVTLAQSAAGEIMALETALARVSKTRIQRRDPDGIYNRLNLSGVKKIAPAFDWKHYFTTLGHPGLTQLNVTAPLFFKGLNKLIKTTKADTWRNYLRWQILHRMASALPKRFVDEAFTLKKVLTGQKEQRKRWKRCIAATDAALGELLAQPFVKKHFGGESKKATRMMVLTISKAFRQVVGTLDWMDPKTRKRALFKLKKMAYLIGFPDKWRQYRFKVGPNYAANLLASRAFDLQFQLKQIGRPIDRNKWEMSPPTVNAYYHPLKNHMVFPAGILQPPFFNVKAHLPVNMGGMGMVVGHELTHGFDDKGSKFDANGNLKNWWEPGVRKKFNQRTRCVDQQYSNYEPLPGIKIKGKLTLGENIADIAGVKLAFMAHRMLRKNARSRILADGFTEDQQFFLSVAQIWCARVRKAYARMKLTVDSHSPPRFRVNGSLSNLRSFSTAFSCKKGSPMYPVKSCRVW